MLEVRDRDRANYTGNGDSRPPAQPLLDQAITRVEIAANGVREATALVMGATDRMLGSVPPQPSSKEVGEETRSPEGSAYVLCDRLSQLDRAIEALHAYVGRLSELG